MIVNLVGSKVPWASMSECIKSFVPILATNFIGQNWNRSKELCSGSCWLKASIRSLPVAFQVNLLEVQWVVEKVGSRPAINVAFPGCGRTIWQILQALVGTFFSFGCYGARLDLQIAKDCFLRFQATDDGVEIDFLGTSIDQGCARRNRGSGWIL